MAESGEALGLDPPEFSGSPMERLTTAEARIRELERAIELDAAHAAYRAGMGASEWEAFVGTATWDVLKNRALSQPPSEEQG